MSKILIFHRQPLEYFPPAMNFLKFLDDREFFVEVLTQKNTKNRIDFTTSNVKISRVRKSYSSSKLSTMLLEITFAVRGIIMALRLKPEVVVYYESTSVLPAFLYSFVKKNVKFVCINHEYLSRQWYSQTASLFTRFYHFLEKQRVFSLCKLIGQTNEERKKLFLLDHTYKYSEKLIVLPNYPLINWRGSNNNTKNTDGVTKLVYVGSSSLRYSYLKKMCDFVIDNQKSYSLDIFSFNVNRETKMYLDSLKGTNVNFFEEGIDYYDLPHRLINYDVGLVLYRGLTPNVKFSVPNKVFEYLACDLEVWCSDKLESTKVFSNQNLNYPIKFLNLDDKLQQIDFDNRGFEYRHYGNDVFLRLLNKIFS